jgi:membrane-associated phospholipid phosphatase
MTGAEEINQVEGAVLRWLAALPRSAPGRWMTGLSTAARGNVLWALICVGLAVRPGTSRRAAVRGATALAGASAASHLLGAVLRHRPRPRVGDLPARRALPEQPSSSSFPSSHAASAAAFTTALWLENPVLGAVVAPVTIVVAYSRVRTRVHWPTDVLAGAALGVLVAVGTRRFPPRQSWVWSRISASGALRSIASMPLRTPALLS